MVTHEQFEAANERAKQMLTDIPRAVSARYDHRNRRIVVQLSSNLGIFFSPRIAEGLESATPEQLSVIEISPSGYGIHFPELDADLYVPGLLAGVFGSKTWTEKRRSSAVEQPIIRKPALNRLTAKKVSRAGQRIAAG